MKKDSTKEKINPLANIVHGTSELSKKVSDSVKNNFVAIAERVENESYMRKVKKYNPLFPEEFRNKDFCIPNIIVIVDDAVRRGIEVCEGAIGWLGTENGCEILYLYDEAVEFSNIKFVPNVACDSVYYVDNLNRNRFIKCDCIFNLNQQERLAELAHIAGSLGAKQCYVEISESIANQQVNKKKAILKESKKKPTDTKKTDTLKCTEKVEFDDSSKNFTKISGRIETEFQGNSFPKKPSLKWFTNDEAICSFIDMRCRGTNTVKSHTFKIDGSSLSTMSIKAACAIDCALASIGGISGDVSMETQTRRETQSSLIFHIEF